MEIKLDFLRNQKVTPNQFYILTLIIEGKGVAGIKKEFGRFNSDPTFDLEELVKNGILTTNKNKYTIEESILESLKDKDSFEELISNFPISVIRKDGSKDYLRISKTKSKRKYMRLTRNRKDIHDYILSCLKFEVQERTRNGTLGWMKRLPNWLDSEGWTEWGEKLNDTKESIVETNLGYGTELC